jgi:pimeloyl-ACP methyl ester carboxylesterase
MVVGSLAVSAAATGPEPPAQRCGPPAHRAATLAILTADGVRLDGAVVGRGPRGVVLVHETGSLGLCGWWPYAVRLAGAGFHVLLFDMRCAGLSACPGGARAADTVADVAAAVRRLRALGPSTVELVGASYGGSVALAAAARLPHIAALADLSGDELGASALRAVAAVHVPLLLAVARDDPYVSLAQERALYRRSASRVKRLSILPASAGHGWDMLAVASFRRQLTMFLESR